MLCSNNQGLLLFAPQRPQYPVASVQAAFRNTVNKCVSTKGDTGENGGSCFKGRNDCLSLFFAVDRNSICTGSDNYLDFFFAKIFMIFGIKMLKILIMCVTLLLKLCLIER